MELRIEIEPGSDPIRGVVRPDNATQGRSFVGWIDLVNLIAVAIEQKDDSGPDAQGHG